MEISTALILGTIAEPGDRNLWARLRAVGANGYVNRLLQIQADPETTGFLYEEVERDWVRRLPSPEQVRVMEQLLERAGITVIGYDDDRYPKQLRDLEAPPLVLYCRGDVSLLTEGTRLGVVGARAASGYGEHVTNEWCQSLADRYTIVSGAAYGIDGMAHRATLAAGGKTIAVLAGGVDRPYPMGHDALLSRIAETGLVVSEMPPGSAPSKWRFLARNRIIAALSAGTLVVEAGVRSGTLNTAKHSISLGRKTFAVPGPITSPASGGCHALLRESPADVALVSHPDHVQF